MQLTNISSGVMKKSSPRELHREKYPFNSLTEPTEVDGAKVYTSFGMIDANDDQYKSLRSAVYARNNRGKTFATDKSGAIIKNEKGRRIVVSVNRQFEIHRVDPLTDPENANVRVYRTV